MLRIKIPENADAAFYPYMCKASHAAWAAETVSSLENRNFFIFCLSDMEECEIFHSKLRTFLEIFDAENFAKTDVKILPPILSRSGSDAENFDAMCERIGTLNAAAEFASGKSIFSKMAVISTPEALFDEAPSEKNSVFLELETGAAPGMESIKKTLCEYGYYNEALCETPGQFSVRGGVIDVYPLASSAPARIDFFGDKIESIKVFDPDTQLSDAKIGSLRIDAMPEKSKEDGDKNSTKAFSYFSKKPSHWFFFEPSELAVKFPEIFSFPENSIRDESKDMRAIFSQKSCSFFGISEIGESGEIFDSAKLVQVENEDVFARKTSSFEKLPPNARFDAETDERAKFVRDIDEWQKAKISVFIGLESGSDKEQIQNAFKSARIKFKGKFLENTLLGAGFAFTKFDENFSIKWKGVGEESKGAAFVSASDFFGRRKKIELSPRRRMLSRHSEADQLIDFSELSEGDYVVHLGQGVCRYLGVFKMDLEASSQEMIKLEFEDGAMLYLPLHKSHLISRYIGLDKRQPKLSKLDSKSWLKIRSSAETATLDYAAELLEMQSLRELAKGVPAKPDGEWQKIFEDSFPYAETPDQLRAAEEVKSDMESTRPMERLLCADVGFGKTEVAMRAAVKCAENGGQTAILCPTTILCQQHFRNFCERFSGIPVNIEMLSRFRSAKRSKQIKRDLSEGKIDIIIGTHALLAKDVSFKNLGLLVIDEEHRFGVKHKEKIKGLKSNIDVLTMSATPIPRTLYFAICGARAISTMETPPKNRFPVETYVREYSPEIVKSAIEKEITRKGQVFYLHNKVKSIEQTAQKIRDMFPSLRVAVGHGQMPEAKLEKLMSEFMDGKYDVLVCTTIIESGLDIPNCNTIIIEGADKFGLAQLYQLRGRVGRFTRRAYAWLLLHRHAALVESARKRLGAIRQYNKPGAGFRIAARDLQLRGCGNILGARQSGHISGIGFDLYCSLLKRSIALLKDGKAPPVLRANIAFDFVKIGGGSKQGKNISNAENLFQEYRFRELERATRGGILEANVPHEYIPQTQLRIDLYRKLAMASKEEELIARERETENRFGKIPKELKNLFAVEKIRVLAEDKGFSEIETHGEFLKLGRQKLGKIEHFKLNGHFPRLTKSNPQDKLREIEKFLRHTLPSINKK